MVILKFTYYILITVKYSGVPPSRLQRAIGGPNEKHFLALVNRERTNFNTAPLWPSLVGIFNGLADFRKFDNVSSLL